MTGKGQYQQMTDAERERFKAAVRAKQAEYELATKMAGTPRNDEPWTTDEDMLLLESPLTTLDLALQFGRSWHRTSKRRTVVRREHKGFTRDYGIVVTKPHKVLCACGSDDDDHMSWCPSHA